MPRSRQPQNATIHSGRFSLQKTTLSPLRSAELVQARRESARGAADLVVGVAAAPEPVVIDEELAAGAREIVEKVNERVAGHE